MSLSVHPLSGSLPSRVTCEEGSPIRRLRASERGISMKPNIIIAILLIALGIVAFAYQGITYTSREKVVDLGPLQLTAEKTRTIPLPPIVGAIALVGGIVLLVMGRKTG